ncbi:MAG: helix-turn-helix transcriptional regulator [Clostridia bacterium]|nr:helix-turn-helix transcriptional regulator [Clostridia bacterium]
MFYENFKRLCSERGTTPTAVAKAMGISTSMTANWKKGGVPRADTLQKVADHFGVSVSYLLGVVDDPDPIALVDPSKKAPPLIEKIDEAMLDMSEEELKDLDKYVEFILSRKKGT